MNPYESASCYLQIHRCLGNTAKHGDVLCHPNREAGKYHVRFGLMELLKEPVSFEEAKKFLLDVQHWLAVAILNDRNDKHGVLTHNPILHTAVREQDCFLARDAIAMVEHVHGFLEEVSFEKCKKWWLIESANKPPFLVVPPEGQIVPLTFQKGGTLQEKLKELPFPIIYPEESIP